MPTVIITGASMGIGRALALRWAARGARVVVSARSAGALDELGKEIGAAGGEAVVVPGDITAATHRSELVERALAGPDGGIDVLVNNAGRGFHAPALAIDLDEMRQLFELNLFAPLDLVQRAAPGLERSRGTIVMLSSIAGVIAAPRSGAYAASKFALEGLSMALRSELAAKGVRVVVVRPGPVDTPFRANAARAPGSVGYDRPDPKSQSVADVVERVVRAVDRGTPVVETSAFVRLAALTGRLAPPVLRLALRRLADRSSE